MLLRLAARRLQPRARPIARRWTRDLLARLRAAGKELAPLESVIEDVNLRFLKIHLDHLSRGDIDGTLSENLENDLRLLRSQREQEEPLRSTLSELYLSLEVSTAHILRSIRNLFRGDERLPAILAVYGRLATRLAGTVGEAFSSTRSEEFERALKAAEFSLERQKEIEQELLRSNHELEQFAYVASHDLQEPLRTVSSYVQLLRRRYEGRLDEDADDFIRFASDGALRMQRLIQDLLLYSRVGTRGRALEPIDATEVFDQTVARLAARIDETGASISRDPLPVVLADPTQLGQLFQNLLSNALKFRREEPPRVHASSRVEGHEWVFSIRDNGIGVEPQYAEKIFVIFQRLNVREEAPGTGMGLAICKKIVERHGGRIWLEPAGEVPGATFSFSLRGPAL